MKVLNRKSDALSEKYFNALPINIKMILSDPFSNGNIRDGATKIIKEAGLNEIARYSLHNIIYAMFTQELPDLESLPLAIQQELETTPEKATQIANIIKEFFIEPHRAFLEKIYPIKNQGDKTDIKQTLKEKQITQTNKNIVNLKEKAK